MTVRTRRRIVEELLERDHDARRKRMLEKTRLLVGDVPLQTQGVDEERLGHPMPPQDVDGPLAANGRQDNAGALANDETLGLQTTRVSR